MGTQTRRGLVFNLQTSLQTPGCAQSSKQPRRTELHCVVPIPTLMGELELQIQSPTGVAGHRCRRRQAPSGDRYGWGSAVYRQGTVAQYPKWRAPDTWSVTVSAGTRAGTLSNRVQLRTPTRALPVWVVSAAETGRGDGLLNWREWKRTMHRPDRLDFWSPQHQRTWAASLDEPDIWTYRHEDQTPGSSQPESHR